MKKYSVEKLPSDILKILADRHRKLRKQKKYSQEELAQRSGVSLGSIKRFEATGKISLESLLKTLHVLGRLNDFDSLMVVKENLNEIEQLFSDKTRK